MLSISRHTKLKIFQVLKDETEVINLLHQQDQLLEFLESIWDLRAMPSTDSRYKDAYGDIVQHTINNYDWDDDFLFLERLELLEDDEKYNLFIENIISPRFREDENDIFLYVQYINPHLENEGLILRVTSYTDVGLPIYTIQEIENDYDLPNDIKRNDITFYVGEHQYAKLTSTHIPSKSNLPCFILVFNSGWNDFGHQTSFYIIFCNRPK